MPGAAEPAFPSGLGRKHLGKLRGKGLVRLAAESLAGRLRHGLGPRQGLVEIGQGFDQGQGCPPGRLGLLGLDGAELPAGLLHGGNGRVGPFLQPPPALRLQFDFVPEGREFANHVDEPEFNGGFRSDVRSDFRNGFHGDFRWRRRSGWQQQTSFANHVDEPKGAGGAVRVGRRRGHFRRQASFANHVDEPEGSGGAVRRGLRRDRCRRQVLFAERVDEPKSASAATSGCDGAESVPGGWLSLRICPSQERNFSSRASVSRQLVTSDSRWIRAWPTPTRSWWGCGHCGVGCEPPRSWRESNLPCRR